MVPLASADSIDKSMGSGLQHMPLCETFQQLPYSLLQLLPIPETQSSRVNVDFITKLPTTVKDGYDCIITIVNPLTKRVQ
jgi:hypothetical protein